METGITYRTLAYTDIETVLHCFNESFKVYYVPLQLTKEQLADKIYAEAIDMKLSYGAFHDDKLVGFILHGIDTVNNKLTAYNAGTGILPGYRGKQISTSLYEYCLDELRKVGIQTAMLDVIDDNVPAKKSYEKTGLRFTRKMISYKGRPANLQTDVSDVKESNVINWKIVGQLCAWKPAWQYNNNTIKRSANNYSFLTVEKDNDVKAYCIANLKNGRVAHFGGEEEIIPALLNFVAKKIETPIAIIHVDESSPANSLILSSGLEHFITSWEMERDI
jgi:ribosomal protein S18 acetylase RimI-like enzyme